MVEFYFIYVENVKFIFKNWINFFFLLMFDKSNNFIFLPLDDVDNKIFDDGE